MYVYMKSFLHRNIKIIKENLNKFRYLAINVIQLILRYSSIEAWRSLNKVLISSKTQYSIISRHLLQFAD